MKTFLKITALAAIMVALLGPARLSASQPAQTYHGTFTRGTFYCNGQESDFRPTVTGTWNLIIDPQTPAQLTLNVFYDGRHDRAFGTNALILLPPQDNGVYVFSAFGGFATATLDTRVTPARFSWHVDFGVSCPAQNPYNSLTFFGVADRGP
jgi:hypothetical protein